MDDEANAAIIEDHERVARRIKLPPQSSSLDIVKNQVYIFYGVVRPLHDGGQDECLEVTRFTSVKDVDLPLYGSCAKVRRQIVKEMDEVAGNTLDEILSQLDQECQVSGDCKDGVRRLVANEQQSDERETYQSPDCPRLDPGIFVCGSDPDDRNVKKKVSLERLAMDIIKKVYEEDCSRNQERKVDCPTKPP